MNEDKIRKLKAAGWRVGSADEFLQTEELVQQHLQLSDLSKTELRNAISELAPRLGFVVEFGADAFGGDGLEAWIEEIRQHCATVGSLCHLVRCHHDEVCHCRCACQTKNTCRVFECSLYELRVRNDRLLINFHNTLEACFAYLQGFDRGQAASRSPDDVARSARESLSSR